MPAIPRRVAFDGKTIVVCNSRRESGSILLPGACVATLDAADPDERLFAAEEIPPRRASSRGRPPRSAHRAPALSGAAGQAMSPLRHAHPRVAALYRAAIDQALRYFVD